MKLEKELISQRKISAPFKYWGRTNDCWRAQMRDINPVRLERSYGATV